MVEDISSRKKNGESGVNYRRWHFNRGISVDSIIALLVFLGGAVALHVRNESRITDLESKSTHHEENDKRLYQQMKTDRDEMRDDLKEIRRMLEERRAGGRQ